ncbi:FirrV-1-B51 [Feldmannia irregularis virus a]|uniref:FirrV-1-B51 n=1 Tax=Feldmannia irregularis virus a TaxID=231992 RepID=Q6XLY5_9PHYC|nr:FirrV-1-B51 [Feldmannia irregularis virus a]AAR26926.1 FirrV-1-B51 [Feldmannia irregularis virus a]
MSLSQASRSSVFILQIFALIILIVLYIYTDCTSTTMPSAFIRKQAKLLYSSRDPLTVLQNIRDEYAVSSFPSQMTRVKQEWYHYKDRHSEYEDMIKKGYSTLKSQNISSRYISQFTKFHNDTMKEQLHKIQQASAGKLTGSRRTDAIIAGIKIMPEYMRDYRLTKEDLNRNKESSSAFLELRAMNCIEVDDADQLVSACIPILKDLEEDVHMIMAALAVVTGRRCIEIAKTGHFMPTPSNARWPYAMRFDGVAKKRGTDFQPRDVPLLAKYKYVRRAVDHVRAKICVSNLPNNIINAKLSHRVGDAAKILTGRLSTRFHDLRAIYGCVTHMVFENTCSINIWLKHVLLHDNIDTSVYYSRCKIAKCTLKMGRWKHSDASNASGAR